MENHYLQIYKASAGSGKTFTLAVNFISLLIKHPDNYRHILAVTFTNKATAEMKQRILSQLYGIAHNLKDSQVYFDKVQEITGMEESIIRQRSAEALTMLIHDYNHFRVETIDSFFQSVLRGLARELNLGTGMTIELDTKRVISEGVDLLLRELSDDDPALKWIVNYISDEIDEGKHWDITDSLKKFSRNIHNETYQRHADELRTQLQNKEIIAELRKRLQQERTNAKKLIDDQVEEFFSIISSHNLSPEDFSYGTSGVCKYYISLRNGEYNTQFTSRTLAASQKPEAWASAKALRRADIINLASSVLVSHLNTTEQIRAREIHTINTCNLVLRHLYQLQLINVIHDRIQRLNRDENRFLLADTCRMLSQMQTGDTSFVFEKLGYYIRHTMIDEFQDTSRMQWNNFLHILREGLSQGNESLIVGDVKQAIYRWRGSDWRILNGEINNVLSLYTPQKTKNLDFNRRSMYEIVEFNNHLFEKCNNKLAELLGKDNSTPLINAYHDVEQKHNDKEEGYVRVVDVEHEQDETAEDAMCRQVLCTIEELLASGIKENDIALLLRTNVQIQRIVEYIAQRNPSIQIFSADAYRLDASTSVKMLIDTLRWIVNPNHHIALMQVAISYHRYVLNDNVTSAEILAQKDTGYGLPSKLIQERNRLLQTPLYELTEELYRLLQLHRIANEDNYQLTFFDRLLQFCSTTSGSIKEFVEHWDDELKSSSIPSGSNNGISAMTIHKSKGLEFQTVIIPFCEWELNKHSGILWTEPHGDTSGSELAITPVPYSETMRESSFTSEYYEEYLQQIVDSYNLLYVACTRPKANLFILKTASKCSIAKDKVMNNVAQLISQALESKTSETREYGTLVPSKHDTENTADTKEDEVNNPLQLRHQPLNVTMCSEEMKVNFRQSNLAKRYITDNQRVESEDAVQSSTLSYLDRGLLLHELFAMIRTIDDVPTAIESMMSDGLFDQTERAEIERITYRALSLPQAADWFSGRYKLFNECTILYRDEDGTVNRMRPDRVMTDDNRFIIVDFKFGRPHDNHKKQVEGYMEQLHLMGHSNVEGYLWYVYENKIQPIPSSC